MRILFFRFDSLRAGMFRRRDYRVEAVFAAKSVLIELAHLLGEYRDEIVLVGE